MSKLANRPVLYPENIKIQVIDGFLVISKGEQTKRIKLDGVDVEINYSERSCIFRLSDSKSSKKANLGTSIALCRGAIKDLTTPYSLTILTNGVGFKAMVVNENILLMWLGRSHLYAVNFSKEVSVTAKDNKIVLSGNKTSVTSLAAVIKTNRKWDPCMQKGVVIEGEFLLKKEAKKKK